MAQLSPVPLAVASGAALARDPDGLPPCSGAAVSAGAAVVMMGVRGFWPTDSDGPCPPSSRRRPGSYACRSDIDSVAAGICCSGVTLPRRRLRPTRCSGPGDAKAPRRRRARGAAKPPAWLATRDGRCRPESRRVGAVDLAVAGGPGSWLARCVSCAGPLEPRLRDAAAAPRAGRVVSEVHLAAALWVAAISPPAIS